MRYCKISMQTNFDTIIIGAGVNGLAAAWQLSRQTRQSIAVLEQFSLGHQQGSSHGASRIIRSTYPDPDLVKLMRHVCKHSWPELEQTSGQKLIHRQSACLFGPEQGLFEAYAAAVKQAGADIKQLTAIQAAKRYPEFDFAGLQTLEDTSGGLIDAKKTVFALEQLSKNNGVQVFENCQVKHIETSSAPIRVSTTDATYQTESLIICCGPWVAQVLPEFAKQVKVVRQTVGYFDLNTRRNLKEFPVWAYLGKDEDDIFYGLPEFGRPGIKAAKHLTIAAPSHPDHPGEANIADLEPVQKLLKQHLHVPVKSVLAYESCLYTLSNDQNFLIDRHPDNAQVILALGFSGHGFKFAPVTGQKLASMVHDTLNGLSEFNPAWEKFALRN